MARRSEHSQEEIRGMLLRAAQSLVDEEGCAALKARRIAREIGYTVASIYMVYANMDDLILHVRDETLRELGDLLDEAIALPQTGKQGVRELAAVYVDFAGRRYNRWSMLFTPRLPGGAALPEWYRQREEGIFARFEKAFPDIAPSRPRRENSRAARALWGGIYGICKLSLHDKSDAAAIQETQHSVQLLVDNFMRGWLAGAE